MIVPMKKAVVIVQSKDSERTLWVLRSMGLLHVEHQTPPRGKEIADIQDDIALVGKAIDTLAVEDVSVRNLKEDIKDLSRWKHIAKHVVDLRARFDQLEGYADSVRRRIVEWEGWGDFNPADIERLAGKGIYMRLYRVPVKEMSNFPESVAVKTVSKKSGLANCVAISRDKPEIPFKEVLPPKIGPGEMQKRLDKDAKILKVLKEHLRRHACYYDDFLRVKTILEKELELSEALRGMGQAGQISYIVGYVPSDKADEVIAAARKNNWAISLSDPSEDDDTPTLIKNPAWVSMMKNVFKLLGIVPGYREFDISPVFLLFLGLFFGMIIGDAGYGALYMLLTFLAERKMARKMRDKTVFRLFYFFSACTIFWGILTGTIFGQQWCIAYGLKPVAPILTDTKFLQAFCFFIGAFHLTIAHMWQAVRKAPSLTALADIGWVMVLWSAFFFAKMLILSDPLPQFVNFTLIGGVSLAIFFTSPQKNILKCVLKGLGAVALSIMNNFTDIVSYIRLFAVGLAGVAIADTINTLASIFGHDNLLIKIGVLLVGHTINIVLGPISVMVHGIRLNVLEFSGHMGLTWSGIPYKPLNTLER